MIILVKRKWLEMKSTVSEVYVNGEFICYGLEDAVREIDGQPVSEWKVDGETAIPYGSYDVEITYSNRFKKDMLQVMNVPGFEGIRIHAGNTDKDTAGCLLVGDSFDNNHPDFIGNSRNALIKLFGIIQAALHIGECVSITYMKG